MPFSLVVLLLVIGAILLVLGIITKKRWLMIISAIPLILSIWQIILLFALFG